MITFERAQKSTLLARLAEEPSRLIIVTGPRQAGKTTLVRQVLNRVESPHRYLAVDEPEASNLPAPFPEFGGGADPLLSDETALPGNERDTRWLVRQWERARVEAGRSEQCFILVFDEIQKIPNWSEAIKGLWDADRRRGHRLHIVLLGSAPLLLQGGLSESLAGRYETVRLAHWSFPEVSEAFGFDLPSYVYFGGYPGAAALIRDQERWREYITGAIVEPNVERDILAMQRVDKPALLKRLFELGAGYSGQILSYNKMLGRLQDAGNTTTLARYLDLLSTAGLITGLANHSHRVHRRRASSPKLNVHNTALMSAVSGYTFEEARADRSFWGRLVESAAGAHLLNTLTPGIRLHYWRQDSHEVDFVLERGPHVVALEIKSGARRETSKGLEVFRGRHDVARTIVVGEGGVPLSEFLSAPARAWFEDS